MTPRYHYIVIETRKHGLTVYAYGVFRGKQLMDKGTFVSREMAETTGQRITNKLNMAARQVA